MGKESHFEASTEPAIIYTCLTTPKSQYESSAKGTSTYFEPLSAFSIKFKLM